MSLYLQRALLMDLWIGSLQNVLYPTQKKVWWLAAFSRRAFFSLALVLPALYFSTTSSTEGRSSVQSPADLIAEKWSGYTLIKD